MMIIQRLTHTLYREVDNSPLILFRIFFGALMFFEGVGAILTGWARDTFVEPAFTFNFIGFDFLQVLAGPQMYAVYILISMAGIAIMLGWHYRLAAVLFTILWGSTYLLQKAHYNNHYYLVWLIGMFLIFVPANRYRSLDAARNTDLYSNSCPHWCILIFQVQIAIVYFYASVAKIYPDWLHARPVELWFSWRTFEAALWSDEFAVLLKEFFSRRSVHYFISYAGIFFDLFVIPAFLWKRTRSIALVASLCFHLSNSLLFQIGVFPYFALAFVVFFYPREKIRRIFFPRKPAYSESTPPTHRYQHGRPRWTLVLLAFFAIQIWLPLRHWRIPGDVLWTEEGHRLSWRMMLRTRTGFAIFRVENEEAGIREVVDLKDYLSRSQRIDVATKPDMMWQFARIIEDDYKRKENVDDVEVYVKSFVSINGRTRDQLTDPDVDISAVPWNRFGHQSWLLPKPF